MRTWYSAVILAIDEKGPSRVRLQDIYSAINRYRPLSDHDHEITFSQENFKHTVRSCLKALQKYKLVDYLGGATYSLTPRSIENIDVFRSDSTGRGGATKEVDISELLRKLGWARKES